MVSTRNKIGAGVVALFVLFGDKILSWYIGFPWFVTWGGAGVVGVILTIFIYVIRRWPSKIRPHADALKKGLEDVRFALFSFIFVGVSDVFYKLDAFLFNFYTYPGPWIMLGLQAMFLVNIAGLQYEEFNLGAKMINAIIRALRGIVRRLRRSRI